MIYSVWNQGLGAFDYYRGGTAQTSQNVEKPSHLVNRTLGSTVDQAAWPLPGNVVKIGSGPHAVGRVASRGGAISAIGAFGDDTTSLVQAGLLVVAGMLAWKYLRRRA
jgi:hypothetical protein